MRKAPLWQAIGLAASVPLGLLAACTTSTGGTGASPPDGGGMDGTAVADGGTDATEDVASEATVDSSTGSDASDATTARDVHVDAPPPGGEAGVLDAGLDGSDGGVETSCAGVLCNGVCLPTNDCSGCIGAPLVCAPRGRCVANCAACSDPADAALPVECYACDTNRQNPRGVCAANNSAQYCLNGDYTAGYLDGGVGFHCLCSADAGASACPGDTQVCAPSPGGAYVCVTCGEEYVDNLAGLACRNGSSCAPASAACQ